MYILILLLPVLGGFVGINRKSGRIGGPYISAICMSMSAILSLIAFYEVGLNQSPVFINLGYWLQSENLNVEWGFIFDNLTVSMLIPVVGVSALVQIYSLGYMHNDPHLSRFFTYLSVFVFFMLIMITADNFMLLFLGWEGVGLSSYLLINFWFTRIAANQAALKAFMLNRVGDWGLNFSLLILVALISDLSLSTIFSLAHKIDISILLLFSLFLLIGVMAKSAQLGLHTWLASAMEGPTPVSALIHAATMVTAGVYLLLRFSPLLEWCPTILIIITWLGGLSALIAASSALLEQDIKKVIAYSTTSQLGYMVVACGLSEYNLSLFHLINHAFFKSLLFLSAGAIIHALQDQQDLRRMGSLTNLLPRTYSAILLASLSLLAFPFLTGFYSKDFLLELALVPLNITQTIAIFLTLTAALFTAAYSTRLLILAFYSSPSFPLSTIHYIQDPDKFMMIPMAIAALASAYFGYLTNELFLGLGSNFSLQSLFTHPDRYALFDPHMIPLSIKLLPPLGLLFFICFYPYQKTKNMRKTVSFPSVSLIVNEGKTTPSYYTYNFQTLIHLVMIKSLNLAIYTHRYFDRGLIELLGPYGLVKTFHYYGFIIESLVTGFIPFYAFLIVVLPLMILGLFYLTNIVFALSILILTIFVLLF